MNKTIFFSLALTSLALGLACNKVAEPDDSAGGAAGSMNSGGSGPGAGGALGGNGGAGTGGIKTSEPECFENPKTHHEIINACTNATRVEKKPKLKLLNEDGSLPEL